MSFHALDIKDYKINKTILDCGLFKFYLIEELKTKNLKMLLQFNITDINIPTSNISPELMFENKHPLFTMILGYCMQNFQGEPAIMIFLNDSPYGNIAKILEDESNGIFIPNFTSTKRYIVLLGISFALKHDHFRGNVNRYLSTNYIYIDDKFYPRFFIDFLFIPDENDSIYKSPEILNGNEYTYASDVYSFSIILYELITGKKPIIKNGEFTDLLIIKSECIYVWVLTSAPSIFIIL